MYGMVVLWYGMVVLPVPRTGVLEEMKIKKYFN